jgi:uncharacterized membrane protein YfcA
MDVLIVTLASALAGFVDSIVGGGGLILVPALFATFPAAAPASMLGTNKSASLWGAAFSTWRYSRHVDMAWRTLLIAAGLTFMGACLGAWTVTQVSPSLLRRALPFVLLALLAYTLARKDLGREHAPRWHGRQEVWLISSMGLVVGFYDGFFGPGAGSFFVFFLVRMMGYDFLHASAGAKLLNTASNAAALLAFSWTGHVWWHLALPLAVANIAGSWLGTRMALQRGAGFVRQVFLVVVGTLILKTGYDAFLR